MLDEAFSIDSKGTYRCQAWDKFVWQKHAFGTRRDNPTADVTLRQIHSAIILAAAEPAERQAEGDGLITDQVGLSIGVRTADCVPILLLDPSSRAVGAVHAGWRGSADRIVVRAIEELITRFGSRPADIEAAIGPAIRGGCYEVSPEVAELFRPWLPDVHRHLDLPQANKIQMLAAGLFPANIFDLGLCTFCHPDRFFSYRRDLSNPGRMLSAIERL